MDSKQTAVLFQLLRDKLADAIDDADAKIDKLDAPEGYELDPENPRRYFNTDEMEERGLPRSFQGRNRELESMLWVLEDLDDHILTLRSGHEIEDDPDGV